MYAHHSIITTGQSGYKTTYGVTRSSWQLFWAKLQQLCKIQWCVGVCVGVCADVCMPACMCSCVHMSVCASVCLTSLRCIHGIGASRWMLVCSGVEVLTKKLFSSALLPHNAHGFDFSTDTVLECGFEISGTRESLETKSSAHSSLKLISHQ